MTESSSVTGSSLLLSAFFSVCTRFATILHIISSSFSAFRCLPLRVLALAFPSASAPASAALKLSSLDGEAEAGASGIGVEV